MGRATQGQVDRLATLNLNLLGAALQLDPLALVPDLSGVIRVELLGDQVEVVVLEHGDAPAKIPVVAQRGDRVERLVVAIQLEAWVGQLRLVPHRRRGKADVRVAGQQRLATGGAAAGHGPGIAALELRQAGVFQGLLAEPGDAVEVAPVIGGQARLEHAFGVPGEVEGLQVVGAQFVAYIGQHRFGTEGRGKAVGHIASDAEGVCGGEGALGDAEDVELQRCRMAGLILVDAI